MRRVLTGVLTLTMLLILTVGGEAASTVTLDFSIDGSPQYLERVQQLIDAFEESHPGIKINMIDAGDEKLLVMVASGTAPDVARMHETTPIELGVRGALMPIGPLVAKDPAFSLDDFFPGALSALSWDGVLYGLPLGISMELPMVNVDQFGRFGVPVPDASWSWEKDVIAHGRRMTVDRNGDGIMDEYFTRPVGPINWNKFYYMAGGRSIQNGRLDWSGPLAAEALQFAADLSVRHGIAPVLARDDPRWGFEAGTVAFSLEGSWKLGILRSARLPFDWAVSFMPSYKGRRGTYLWNETPLGILSSTEHPKEAWEFFKFLTGPNGQRLTAELGLAMPASRRIAREFVSVPPPPANLGYALTLATSPFNSPENPLVPGWTRVRSTVTPQIERVLNGEAPAGTVLDDVTSQVNAVVEELLERAGKP